jgi:hypothetical protein
MKPAAPKHGAAGFIIVIYSDTSILQLNRMMKHASFACAYPDCHYGRMESVEMHRRPYRSLFALIVLIGTVLGCGIPAGALADSPGPPANVSFSPGVTTKTVGEFVTEVATVTDAEGNLVADGTPGAWSVTVPGSTPANITRIDTITKDGQVTLTFSTTTVGTAQIKFTAGYAPDTASGSTSITWIAGPPARITLSPGNATANVDGLVSEVATVSDAYGNPVANGTTVTFTITGANPRVGTFPTSNGQANLNYSGALPGTDTLTASAGSAAPATAQITWTAADSTARASLNIVSPFSPSIIAMVQTNARGGAPHGQLLFMNSAVRLQHVQFTGLIVNGNQATLYGSARLAGGTPVIFRLDATEGPNTGSVRLRLSTGYDSGTQTARWVQIQP